MKRKNLLKLILVIIIINSIDCISAFSEEEQSKIINEIEKFKREIQICEQYEESLIATIDKLSLQAKLKEKEIIIHNAKVKELERNIDEINLSIEKLEKEIFQIEEQIKRKVIAAYKMGTLGYYKLLLYPEDINTLIKSFQFVSIISKKDLDLIKKYQENKLELIKRLEILKLKQNELIDIKKGIEFAKYEIAKALKEKSLLLENIRTQKELFNKAINELNVSAKKLENLINDFGSSINLFDLLPDIKKFKGVLEWPLKGKMIKLFGKVKHEKFNTYTFNKGIEIAIKEGTEVRAIFDGKVVFTDWFQGYGKTVIIEHKGHVFSIYAHNSEIVVKTGDIIHGGDIIAYSGSTGSLEGESLYFEIREGRQPVNPLIWLKKIGK